MDCWWAFQPGRTARTDAGRCAGDDLRSIRRPFGCLGVQPGLLELPLCGSPISLLMEADDDRAVTHGSWWWPMNGV